MPWQLLRRSSSGIVRTRRALRSWANKLMLRLRFQDIEFGARCTIEGSVEISVVDGGRLELGTRSHVRRNATLIAKHGHLVIGDESIVGIGSVICARESLSIGRNVLIAEYVTIRDHDHNFGPGMTTAQSGFKTAPVRIEDNVWIGAKATLLAGVSVGSNSVIAAGAVVTQDVPADSVAAGVPARVIKNID